jgi:hypothetical protein
LFPLKNQAMGRSPDSLEGALVLRDKAGTLLLKQERRLAKIRKRMARNVRASASVIRLVRLGDEPRQSIAVLCHINRRGTFNAKMFIGL